jgi:hypothetical protein
MNEPTPIHDRLAAQYGIRTDMRRGLIDEIAAASIDGVMAGIDVMLTFERLNWDDAS